MTPDAYDLAAAQQVITRRIREAIMDSRLTSEQVAEKSDYSPSHLRRLRNGEGGNPTIAGLWSLAKALDVNPYWLMGAPRTAKRLNTDKPNGRDTVLVSELIGKASELFDVHRRDILGPYRYNFLMPARFALCKALRNRGMSYPHIGRVLERDHSTVIHAIRRADYMIERDTEFADKVRVLTELRPKPIEEETDNG